MTQPASNLGFIEQAWRRLMQLIGGPQSWTLAQRANQNAIIVRTMRKSRTRI